MPDRRRIRVLLVEDNPGDQRLVTEMLAEARGEEQFQVTCATRAEQAADHLGGQGPVDVVLLDLSLPDADGLAGLRRLFTASPTVPVVVLTGRQSDELALDAVRNGAQDYLCKSDLNGAWLRSAIRFAIERQQLLQQVEQMQEQLLALERDRVVAQTAGAAAHEINNPLTGLVGLLDLLDMDSDDPALRQRLGQLRALALRIRDVVARMARASRHATREYLPGRHIIDFERAGKPPDP